MRLTWNNHQPLLMTWRSKVRVMPWFEYMVLKASMRYPRRQTHTHRCTHYNTLQSLPRVM